MSNNRRRLVAGRNRPNVEEPSPAATPRSRQRASDMSAQSVALPPYQSPACPLTATAKRKLDDLKLENTKYRDHIKAALTVISNSAIESNERLAVRRAQVQKQASKRQNQENGVNEKPDSDIEHEEYTGNFEKKVEDITAKAEKAFRDLMDWDDERSVQSGILADVSENVTPVPAGSNGQRRRRPGANNEDEDEEAEEENEAAAADAEVLSAVELYKKAKDEYAAGYAAKSMLDKYDVNSYRQFKRGVHEALYQGDDAPPVPHARTWFGGNKHSSSRRSMNRADNANNGDEDDSDDEVVIQSATTTLKCPLTLKYFEEPYSNYICKHAFERAAIIDYHHINGVAFAPPAGQPSSRGEKRVNCPQTGCEKMLSLKDFYPDNLLLRQVKRAQKKESQQDDDDDDGEDDDAPRGTQRSRPERIGSESEDDDAVDIDELDHKRKAIARVKRERQSRTMSVAPCDPGEQSIVLDDESDGMNES